MRGITSRCLSSVVAVLLLMSFTPSAHAEPYPDGINWDVWADGCILSNGADYCASLRGWAEYNGGLSVFGLPIGKVKETPRPDGRIILESPFERFRVDFDELKMATPYAFELGIMGEAALLKQGRVWHNEPKATPREGCDFFSETGHNACGAFRDFWRSHGMNFDNYDTKYQGQVTYEESLALLGFPITEEEQMTTADGKTLNVQYFQRGRLELHPENANTPYYVQMGLLNSEVSGETAWTLLPGNAGNPVAAPQPQPQPQPQQPQPQPNGGCDPNYAGACIPNVPYDLDCGDIPDRNFRVVGSDVHRFDRDNDGIACES